MFLFIADSIENGIAQIGGEEAAHALRVLRMKPGDGLLVTSLDGTMHEAAVSSVNKDSMTAGITASHPHWQKRGYRLRICIAPTKNSDRYEWFLEKAVEMGVDRITPVCCDRSERKAVKRERGLKIIRSAVKQSMKASMPVLDEMTAFDEVMKETFSEAESLFIAHCDENSERTDIRDVIPKNGNYTVMIGPEGDFSAREISLAAEMGYIPVTFGSSRLRTETAGVWAAALASIVN